VDGSTRARKSAGGIAPDLTPFHRVIPEHGSAGRAPRVDRVIERVTQLPFSPVAMNILEVAWDERAGARDMAKVIVLDQAFTARLLRIANSPFYGQSREVTTVSQAVAILGMDAIASLALTLFTFGSLPEEDNEILSIGQLWEHCLGCGIWARAIATLLKHRTPEESFIAGLLHDMGKVLLYRFFKKELLQAVEIASAEGLSLSEAEQRTLGTDHAVVGQAAADQWGFPPLLRYSIAFHRAPMALPRDAGEPVRQIVAIVHVADFLCESSEIGNGGERGAGVIDGSVWDLLRIKEDECREMIGPVLVELEKSRELFASAMGWKKPAEIKASQPNGARSGEITPFRTAPEAAAPAAAQTGAYLSRFVDAGKQIAVLAGLDELLPNVAAHAMKLLDADAAEVLVPKDGAFEVAGAAGIEALLGKTVPRQRSLAGWVAEMKEALVIADLDRAPASWEKDFFGAAGYRAHLLLPVEWAGKSIAVLSVHCRRERRWSPQDIGYFNTFVGLTAVALENARLYRESEEKAVTFQKLNQALQEALHVKDKFLHIVSHELRTPLSIIMAYPGMILNDIFGETTPPIREGMKKIMKAAKHLLTMIDNILDLSQLEGNLLKARREPVDLPGLLDETAEPALTLIEGKPIAFERDYRLPLPTVYTDPRRLKQVVTCLLDNAAKFTRQGTIVLGVAAVPGGIEIFVTDTGIGIGEKDREVIFDRFRQIDDGDARTYGGLGLGLYTARRLLDLVEGTIAVESQVGQGSTFRVRLPLGQPLPAAAGPGSKPSI
jgi:signal transduction histidine kinase/HD-like signal output (HDOD) protein